MTAKLRSCLLFLGLCFLNADALSDSAPPIKGVWADSPTGKCFNSIDEYFKIAYGPNYRQDENIKSFAAKNTGSSIKLAWAMDLTPGTNVTSILFRLFPSGKACAILFAPLSSSTDFKLTPQGLLPDTVISRSSPPPGFPATEVRFKLNRKTKNYYPSQCQTVGPGKKRVVINCSSAFSE